MRYMELSGLRQISRIGLGTWQFGSREWGYGEAYAAGEARALVRRALELGVTLFDTAEVYAFGRSERILGEALGDDGDDVVVATKLLPVAPLPAVVRNRALASRGRLGLRRIPLYQVHWPNPLVPEDTVMRGLHGLQDEGVIGDVGVSNYSLARWRRAERALGRRVLSNQVPFSLARPQPSWELVPWARERSRVVVAYSPLAQGLLGGRYSEHHRPGGVRAANPLFLPDNLRRVAPLLARLREVADAHDATPAQVALAWVLRFDQVVAIPGASSVAQLEANVAAAEIDLADDENAALTAEAERFSPARGMRAVPDLARTLLRR
ncbi:MAG: aldo/keto reductase [Carbonactinosporaceae bacterium]